MKRQSFLIVIVAKKLFGLHQTMGIRLFFSFGQKLVPRQSYCDLSNYGCIFARIAVTHLWYALACHDGKPNRCFFIVTLQIYFSFLSVLIIFFVSASYMFILFSSTFSGLVMLISHNDVSLLRPRESFFCQCQCLHLNKKKKRAIKMQSSYSIKFSCNS